MQKHPIENTILATIQKQSFGFYGVRHEKKILCALSILGLLLGCESNSTSTQELANPQGKIDTLVVMDTVVTSRIDTVVVSKKDSVIVSKIDTVVVMDTIIAMANDTGTGILDYYPDDVMIPILENLTHQKRDPSFSLREKQIVILHFTDIHGHEENLKRIKEFYDHYSKYIDIVLHTGDALYDKWTNSFDFWDNAGAEKFLNVLGNHDVNFVDKDGNPLEVTQQEVYNRYFGPYISNWNVVTPRKCRRRRTNVLLQGLEQGNRQRKI